MSNYESEYEPERSKSLTQGRTNLRAKKVEETKGSPSKMINSDERKITDQSFLQFGIRDMLANLPQDQKDLIGHIINTIKHNYKPDNRLKKEQPETLKDKLIQNCETILGLKNNAVFLIVKEMNDQESEDLFQIVSFALKVQLEEERAASGLKPPATLTEKDIAQLLQRADDQIKRAMWKGGKPCAELFTLQVQELQNRHDQIR